MDIKNQTLAVSNPTRHERTLTQNWRFALGDRPEAAAAMFDDSLWRKVDLPHDWSVEAPFDAETCEGATGYLPGGIGWYRREFTDTELQRNHRMGSNHSVDKKIFIVFDGVYNHSDVWINGCHLGRQEYGYSPFVYELTDHLDKHGPNQLAVRVDHSRYCDSRWYTGSGIYRDVRLVSLSPIHIPVWGTYINTPKVSSGSAEIHLHADVCNTTLDTQRIRLATAILTPDGVTAAEAHRDQAVGGGEVKTLTETMIVDQPHLWNTSTPNLYVAETTLWIDDEEIDRYRTQFGLRDIRFDAATGFYLNGEPTLIKGVCLHHEAGLVGAAVPRGVWRRRLQKLKDAGCNAIRTAHNPPSEPFLDLCDEMGFLVQHEFFDEWDRPKDKRTNFNQKQGDEITRGYSEDFGRHAESDLKKTMRRDRNHPCIFMWSIGNEIEWCYPRYRYAAGYWDSDSEADNAVNYYFSPEPPHPPAEILHRFKSQPVGEHHLAKTAQRLAAWTREMDSTRPVVANLVIPSISHQSGYTDALDLIGYSYRACLYDYGRRLYPNKPILGTENWTQWHEWKAVLDRDDIAGLFLWTGIDYMGEAAGNWPIRGSASGLLDLAGFDKPSYHLFKSLWSDEPYIRLFTQILEESLYTTNQRGELIEKEPGAWRFRKWGWHTVNPYWNYKPGQRIVVEAYTNCPSVQLKLNNKSVGNRRLDQHEDHICKWLIDYEPGILEACSIGRDDRGATHRLATTGEPTAVKLIDDSIGSVGEGVYHVVAQLVDGNGRPVRHVEREIMFEIDDGLRSLGVDNGAIDSVQPFRSDRVTTHCGRALLIATPADSRGRKTITACSPGLDRADSDTLDLS